MSAKTKEKEEVVTFPTSFRLSREAVYAVAKACKLYRLSRSELIEFLATAAISGGHSEIGTEMAKMTIDSTVPGKA